MGKYEALRGEGMRTILYIGRSTGLSSLPGLWGVGVRLAVGNHSL
jgi:hypothetical protein